MRNVWPRLLRMLAAVAVIVAGGYVLRPTYPALALVLMAAGAAAGVLVLSLVIVLGFRPGGPA